MKALLWKDFRINLPIVVAAVLLCSAPYIAQIVAAVSSTWPALPAPPVWGQVLVVSSYTSLFFVQLITGFLGANAMASERADRSAEFLFYLPPSKLKILNSKFLLALGLTLTLWLANLLAADVIGGWLAHSAHRFPDDFPARPTVAATGVFIFGATWLASSFLSSTAYAFLAGAGLYGAVCAALYNTSVYLGWPAPGSMVAWYRGTCLALGCVTFAAGFWYYLRRVEP
jgi:ABC-type Na+ efflux pump permease subunit